MLYLVRRPAASISFLHLVDAPAGDPGGRDLHPLLVDHDEVGLRAEVERADPGVHPESLQQRRNDVTN